MEKPSITQTAIHLPEHIVESARNYTATAQGFKEGTIGGVASLALLNLSSNIGERVVGLVAQEDAKAPVELSEEESGWGLFWELNRATFDAGEAVDYYDPREDKPETIVRFKELCAEQSKTARALVEYIVAHQAELLKAIAQDEA